MTDQPSPETSSVPEVPEVPEVKPTEHIAPETPPMAAAPGSAEPTSPESSAPAPTVSEAPTFITPAKPRRPERPAVPKPPNRDHYTLLAWVSALRALIVTFAAAVIAATIFMWWTSPDFLSAGAQRGLAVAQATAERSEATPTFLPTPIWFNRVGIIAGHSGIATSGRTKGNVDPGSVCPDGFTEASVNMGVAQRVIALLKGRGFTTDLLEEWDTRLDGYQAAALVSLHSDACENFNDGYNHSGFKSTYPPNRFTARDNDLKLDNCIRQNYGGVTHLPFQAGSITEDMTDYHAFHQVAPTTPVVIIELGFLSYDRDLLQNHQETLAEGVFNGIQCFFQPVNPATPVPSPTSAPVSATAKP